MILNILNKEINKIKYVIHIKINMRDHVNYKQIYIL